VLSSYKRKKGRRERRLRGKLSLTLLKPSNYIEELKPRRKGKKIYEATLLHSHLLELMRMKKIHAANACKVTHVKFSASKGVVSLYI